jgi:membrane-bound serine protease (ClpP class)
MTISIDGAIGPASASYVRDALANAGERHAEVVILRLNTPGGLNTSMREIIADVLASSVPVIGYVAPSGAHAASAGTYILYATHIAAMAPGTNIGAATPVQIGSPMPGLPSAPDKEGKDNKGGDHQAEPKDAMTAKVPHPQPRRAARPQCRLGREGSSRGRHPVCQRLAAGTCH